MRTYEATEQAYKSGYEKGYKAGKVDAAHCPVDRTRSITNADRLRSMTDEELARVLYNGIDAEYCSNDPTCGAMLDESGGVPEERCIACALKWLRQPAGEA